MTLRLRALPVRSTIAKRSARTACVGGTTALAMFAAAGIALAGQPPATTPDQTEANRLMNLTADDFGLAPQNPPFDWSNNECSGPTRPEFTPACVQHDFGYRNYGARGDLGFAVIRDTKDWIDQRFHEEMYRICEDYASVPQAATQCVQDADNAFTAVQLFGDSSFFR